MGSLPASSVIIVRRCHYRHTQSSLSDFKLQAATQESPSCDHLICRGDTDDNDLRRIILAGTYYHLYIQLYVFYLSLLVFAKYSVIVFKFLPPLTAQDYDDNQLDDNLGTFVALLIKKTTLSTVSFTHLNHILAFPLTLLMVVQNVNGM